MMASNLDSTTICAELAARHHRVRMIIVGLVVSFVVATLAAVSVGAVVVSPGSVVAAIAAPLGLQSPWDVTDQQAAVVSMIRLPRVLLGVVVGASLAISGALLQGLFRNPLADPGLVGVSSGAAVGAASMIVLGPVIGGVLPDVLRPFLTTVGAFAFGLATTVIVYRIATRRGRTSVATMLLAGIAVNALCGAAIGLLVLVADDGQLRDITFWTLGGLGGATWKSVLIVLPLLAVVLGSIRRLANPLNAMLLGEAEARYLGIDTEAVKKRIVVLAAVAVAAATSFAGLIGFIGLVAPHIVRLTLGPDHRSLLPASALTGATLLVVADVLARTVLIPSEIPLGIVTALCGAPVFLWLLLSQPRAAV